MTSNELAELHRLVGEADAFAKRPLEEGETSRPITFFAHHLPEEGWRLGWLLVGVLRAEHPQLFLFYDEQSLHYEALELLVAASSVPSIDQLAETLKASAQSEEGSWLISVPIANAALDRAWAPAGPSAALRRAAGWQGPMTAEQEQSAGAEDAETEFAVYHHLHDRLTPTVRHLRFGDGREVDTKRLVCMLLIEEGARLNGDAPGPSKGPLRARDVVYPRSPGALASPARSGIVVPAARHSSDPRVQEI